MNRSTSLNDGMDGELYELFFGEEEQQQAVEMEELQAQLHVVSLEEAAGQVGHQVAAGSHSLPIPPHPPMEEGEVWAEEARQAQRIRREVQDMERVYLEQPMSDFEKALAEYHALDLRELNYAVRDLIVEADTALPMLSPLLDTSGPDDIEPRTLPNLDHHPPVMVSSIRPVFRALRDLSMVLENQVQNQAQLTGIGAFGSGPWYIRNADERHASVYGPNCLNLGPPLTPHISNPPPTTRTTRQNRTARN